MEDGRSKARTDGTIPGWVYFISPFGGAVEEPPAPIKIGSTTRDPYNERLPELETGSSKELEILWTIRADDPIAVEKAIHEHLKPFRQRGEWFDRDATLAWIDYAQSNSR